MTHHLLLAHTRAMAALRATADRARDERGDVPGWVLITLMTAALVTGIWALAGEQLRSLFTDAINGVTGPNDPR